MDWSGARGCLIRHRDSLFRRANVVGCGIGYKRVGGQPTMEPAVCVFVRRKLPPGALRAFDVIPGRLDGVCSDVIEAGDLRLLGIPARRGGEGETAPPTLQEGERTSRRRPAQPGVSVAHFLVTAGTLGAIARDGATGRLLILSNNHVLANSTDGRDGRASPGDAVLQPGPYDGGREPDDVIARLLRFVPLRAGPRRVENQVDAAVAAVIDEAAVIPDLLGIGPPQGAAAARMGMPVRISGRTSGVRSGSIVAMEVTADVGMATGATARFVNQLATTPIAQPGDSGSLVVDTATRAVGLLFAGSSSLSLANPIQPVLDALGITLVG